jgi:release factor glutamine methyltransferase
VTLEHALRLAREAMSQHKIEDAALESEVLLRHTLNYSRGQLYLYLNQEISINDAEAFHQLVERRLAGEPTAYIKGHREFYGLEFYVDHRVLIPRPESELLVEEAVKSAGKGARSFADIGTGSGAIAVSLAVNVPQARIYAVDISTDALAVARDNCLKYGVQDRIRLLHGNLIDPLPERVDVIIANLPYVRQADLAAVNTYGYEPSIALDGGPDGLETIRRLTGKIITKLKPGGRLLLEIGQGQVQAILDNLDTHMPGSQIEIVPDLGGVPRVVSLSLPAHQN